MDILDLVFLVFMPLSGLVLVILGLRELKKEQLIRTQGVEANALVVEFKSRGSTVVPIVEFQTEQGLFQAKSKYSASRIFYSFKKGDTVQIKYNNENPKQFFIVGNHITTFLWSMIIFMGSIEIILGIVLHFLVTPL